MATQFKITKSGKEEIVTVKPKHVLRSEREGGIAEASVESTFRLAYFASGSTQDFDEWIEDVDDITPILDEDTEADIPPTTKGSRRSRS